MGIKNAYLNSPKFRFYLRTFVVGVLAYVTSALSQGAAFGDWQSFAWGAFGAGANAVIGLLTPTEPLVGLSKDKFQPTAAGRLLKRDRS